MLECWGATWSIGRANEGAVDDDEARNGGSKPRLLAGGGGKSESVVQVDVDEGEKGPVVVDGWTSGGDTGVAGGGGAPAVPGPDVEISSSNLKRSSGDRVASGAGTLAVLVLVVVVVEVGTESAGLRRPSTKDQEPRG